MRPSFSSDTKSIWYLSKTYYNQPLSYFLSYVANEPFFHSTPLFMGNLCAFVEIRIDIFWKLLVICQIDENKNVSYNKKTETWKHVSALFIICYRYFFIS